MIKYIKLFFNFKKILISDKRVAEKKSQMVAPIVMDENYFNSALNYLDNIWIAAGHRTSNLNIEFHLWHCGIVSFQKQMKNTQGIWLTSNKRKKMDYSKKWIYESKKLGLSAYLYEFRPRKSLICANFNGEKLLYFCMKFCNSDHSKMEHCLSQWAMQNKFQGIQGVNGNHEFFIINPIDNLEVQFSKRLS